MREREIELRRNSKSEREREWKQVRGRTRLSNREREWGNKSESECVYVNECGWVREGERESLCDREGLKAGLIEM